MNTDTRKMTLKQVTDHITAAHVREAFAEIDKRGVPSNRRSTKWCVKVGDKRYPPKYVLSVAAKIATGNALPPHAHNGGDDTNNILKRLGFEVAGCIDGGNAPEN